MHYIWQNSLHWYPDLTKKKCDWLQVPGRWTQFTYDKAMDGASDKITPSLRLLANENGPLDDIVVKDYLNLLRRQSSPDITIIEPCELKSPSSLRPLRMEKR